MFGWTDNQVQANVVARQLQIIFQSVLWLFGGGLPDCDRLKSGVSTAVMGAARTMFLNKYMVMRTDMMEGT